MDGIEILHAALDSGGTPIVHAIVGVRSAAPFPGDFDTVIVDFDVFTLELSVNDADELALSKPDRSASPSAVQGHDPLLDDLAEALRGASLKDYWVLVNSHGYSDGIQLVLQQPCGALYHLQFYATAGRIVVPAVNVDRRGASLAHPVRVD